MRPARAVAVGVLLLATACSTGSGPSLTARSSSPTPRAVAPATTRATAPEASDLPGNTGDDPAGALRAIVRYRHHLFEVPRPDLVGLIYAPACTCSGALRAQVERFARSGYALEGPPPRLSDVRVVERTGALATVRYTVQSAAGLVRDRSGAIVQRGAAAAARRFESQLLLAEGRWLVQTIREVTG